SRDAASSSTTRTLTVSSLTAPRGRSSCSAFPGGRLSRGSHFDGSSPAARRERRRSCGSASASTPIDSSTSTIAGDTTTTFICVHGLREVRHRAGRWETHKVAHAISRSRLCGLVRCRQTLERTTAEHLAEEDPDVGAGPTRELADHVVAVAPVERGRLIAVRVEVHLVAAAAQRFGFGAGEQARPETVPAKLLVDPDRLDEAGPAPRPAMQAGHHGALSVAHEDRERAPVVDAARGGVELVEPLVEERDVLPARIVFDLEVFGRPHRLRQPAWTASASSSSTRMVSRVGTPVAGSQPCST